MPIFAILATTAQVRLRVNAAHLHPNKIADRESRRQRDIEATVAVEIRRIVAVELQAFLVRDEHRHFRSVFARVENLLRFVVGRIEIDFRLAEDSALAGRQVVTIDRGRRSETGERVERFFVRGFAAETVGGADARKRDFVHQLACRVVDLYLRVRVLQVVEDEFVVNERGRLEVFLCLRERRLSSCCAPVC